MKYSIIMLLFLSSFVMQTASIFAENRCAATEPDMLGPFYKPGAPERSRVGDGYILSGVVRSTHKCEAVPGATIEFWLTGPDGEYGDDYRATMHSGPDGAYSFESNTPVTYYGRPPHIHIRVSAKGFRTLVTQHYPKPKTDKASFDLVLIPE